MSNNTPRSWDEYFEAVEAEIEPATPEVSNPPEPTDEERRYQEKKEARELLARATGKQSTAPIGPDATAKEIVAQVKQTGRQPDMRRVTFINASKNK